MLTGTRTMKQLSKPKANQSYGVTNSGVILLPRLVDSSAQAYLPL